MLDLTHFETVLHISILLNFLYAVSDQFSERIFPLLSSPFRESFQEDLNSASEAIANMKNPIHPDQTLLFEQTYIELTDRVKMFNESAKRDYVLGPKFKSVYLFAGLYSFLLLIIAGMQSYLDPKFNCGLFYSNCIVIAGYLVVFIATFFNDSGRIKAAWALLVFFILVIFQALSYFFSFLHLHKLFWNKCFINQNCISLFSIVIALLPLVLHIARATIKLMVDYTTISKGIKRLNNALSTVQPPVVQAALPDDMDEIDKIINKYLHQRNKDRD